MPFLLLFAPITWQRTVRKRPDRSVSRLDEISMHVLMTLDRYLKPPHVVAANLLAFAWFVGTTVAGRRGLPGVGLVRCPVGFCAGGYSPEDLYSMLDEIGEEGRAFLHDTMLRADLLLPALLVIALLLDIAWFSRFGGRASVRLQPLARAMLLCVPILYGIADYLENVSLAHMLRVYPNIEDVMAERASMLTAAKSQLFAASAGIAAALAITAWGNALGLHRNPDR